MARETHEREDLLRDATALVPRIMLRLERDGKPCEVFAGFRKEGAVSLYFDDDPVYHFNSAGELRRAFVDDCLVKAEQGRLVAMRPRRTAESTDLVRHELSAVEQKKFLAVMQERISWLREELAVERFEVVGQMPESADARAQLADWLEDSTDVRIAESPRVR